MFKLNIIKAFWYKIEASFAFYSDQETDGK
jgi:hypothetical protein